MTALEYQGPNELTMPQREEMRARQDAFIAAPQIKGWRSSNGDDWPIHGTDGPSINDLRQELYPDEQGFLSRMLDGWTHINGG